MDDDDEFGELYDDVLIPLSSISCPPPNSPPSVENFKAEQPQTTAATEAAATAAAGRNPSLKWMPYECVDDDDYKDEEYDPIWNYICPKEDYRNSNVGGGARVEDPEPPIPGISDGGLVSNVGARVSNWEWESDSEDDFKIIVNDDDVDDGVDRVVEEEVDEDQEYYPQHVTPPPLPPQHVMEKEENGEDLDVVVAAAENGVVGFGDQGFLAQEEASMVNVSSFLVWNCS